MQVLWDHLDKYITLHVNCLFMSTFDAYGVKVLLILCCFILEIHHYVASYINKVEHSLCVEFSQVQVLGCVDCQIPKEGLCHYLFYVFGCLLLESIMDLFPSCKDGVPQWGWGWLEVFGEEPSHGWGLPFLEFAPWLGVQCAPSNELFNSTIFLG